MGTYLNEGNALYAESVNSEIHVDKSLLIRETNRRIRTQDKYVCLSRPRRFGKSMAAHMLMAYYTRGADSRELFKDKKIYAEPSFERHFGKYNVIHLRMTDFVAGGIDAMVATLVKMIRFDIEDEAAALSARDDFKSKPAFRFRDETDLGQMLQDFFVWSGAPYVFVIDEWDCLMRETAEDEENTRYMQFLRCLLKDRAYVALVWMTGKRPINQHGGICVLNMFSEFSEDEPEPFDLLWE